MSAPPSKKTEIDPNHAVDPHHGSDGVWYCYVCKRRLHGSFMNPTIPWRHKDDPAPEQDPTEMPGLATTE